jgi:chaperonin GroES
MLKLLRNTVLLQPLPPKTVSDGGVHLAMQYQDDRKQWRVLAVGPGRRLKTGLVLPPEVQPGDRVLYNPDLGNRYAFSDRDREHYPGCVIADADRIEMKW